MPGKGRPKRRPAQTVEGRENQLVSLAMDLAEKQLQDGTASSQVISHFLKAGSTREQLERERLRSENVMLKAKAEAMESAARTEEMYAEALTAMRSYQPEVDDDRDEQVVP
jgi:hypothetical protein